jgi:hypothetical protein
MVRMKIGVRLCQLQWSGGRLNSRLMAAASRDPMVTPSHLVRNGPYLGSCSHPSVIVPVHNLSTVYATQYHWNQWNAVLIVQLQ